MAKLALFVLALVSLTMAIQLESNQYSEEEIQENVARGIVTTLFDHASTKLYEV